MQGARAWTWQTMLEFKSRYTKLSNSRGMILSEMRALLICRGSLKLKITLWPEQITKHFFHLREQIWEMWHWVSWIRQMGNLETQATNSKILPSYTTFRTKWGPLIALTWRLIPNSTIKSSILSLKNYGLRKDLFKSTKTLFKRGATTKNSTNLTSWTK